MKHTSLKVFFLLGALCILPSLTKAQVSNFQVYSLFVINIAKYSAWPETSDEFKITVFGKSQVYTELQKYSTRGFNGKQATVTQTNSLSDIGDPNIIYLSSDASRHLSEILELIKDKPIMVVTEQSGLYKKGAGFSFFVNDQNNMRFDINLTDLEKRGIKVAKNLSGMAHDVL